MLHHSSYRRHCTCARAAVHIVKQTFRPWLRSVELHHQVCTQLGGGDYTENNGAEAATSFRKGPDFMTRGQDVAGSAPPRIRYFC